MYSRLLFWMILFHIAAQTSAQDNLIGDKHKPRRSDYVLNLTNKINITPFLYDASNTFTFSGGKKSVEFSPNEAPSLGLRLQHKWLGFAFVYGPKNIQEDKKGKSDYFTFAINSYGKKIGFDVYYLTNKGYYIRNDKAKQDINPKQPYPQRADLATKGIGFNVYYVFNNKKYSYRSSFIHNEIQRKTAGSFLLTFSGSYYQVTADSSIVPKVYSVEVAEPSQLREGSFYSIGLLPGYAFTWVVKERFYATASFSFGLMYQIQSYSVKDIANSEQIARNTWISRGLGRLSIGYNSKYLYFGVSSVGDNYHIPLGNGSRLQYTIGNAQLFIGTRLNFPHRLNFISEAMDKMPVLAESPDIEP